MKPSSLIGHPLFPVIGSVLAIFLTAWISIAPLNNLTQKDISDIYENILTPAGFTFSIWSVIYLSWIVWAILPFIPPLSRFGQTSILIKCQSMIDRWTHSRQEILGNDSTRFVIAMILSVLWLIAWHYLSIGLSVVIMSGLLALLWGLYRRSSFLSTPFSVAVELTFAWIAIALVANLGAYIVSLGWVVDTMDNERLAWFLGFPAIIAIILLHSVYRSVIGLLVTSWALIGLIGAQSSFPLVQLVSLVLLLWAIINIVTLSLRKIKMS